MTLPIGSSYFHLNNVYVIPSMRKNLLSIAQFCQDNHVLCAFNSHHFYIFDLTHGSLLYQGPCKYGLYKLPALPSRLQAISASHQSSSLWHNRLGHPSSKVMSFLGSNNFCLLTFLLKSLFVRVVLWVNPHTSHLKYLMKSVLLFLSILFTLMYGNLLLFLFLVISIMCFLLMIILVLLGSFL